jgi:DNA-binding NarL/FixJ family response regulator
MRPRRRPTRPAKPAPSRRPAPGEGRAPEDAGGVLLVEDHQAVRELIREALGPRLGVRLHEAGDMLEALGLARRHRPRLAVVDIGLPGANGIELIRRLRRESPATRVLVFSSMRNHQVVRGVMQAGANGFVEKTEPLATLRQAALAVLSGRSWFSEAFHRQLAESLAQPTGENALISLTPREREVLLLVAQSHSSKEVSARLGVSLKTAENHRNNLMRKLGLHDTAALVRMAIREGIVDPELA